MPRPLLLACLTLFVSISILAQAANPVPFVNQPLVPASVAPGSAGFTLTVNGTGFVSTSVVKWNGSPRTTTFINSSQLHAAIPSSDVASAGSATVTVNSGGPDSNQATLWITTAVSTISFHMRENLRAFADGLLTADFNGDKLADIVLTTGFSTQGNFPGMAGILLGTGSGTFQHPVNYQTAPETSAVAMGDFNADGKLDLAVSGQRSNLLISPWAVSILLGNGDGTFQPAINYGSTIRGGSRVLVADFNGDGNLDVAAIDAAGTGYIAVKLGDGDGTFQPAVLTPAANSFTAVGDFNGDGILDLAGINFSGPAVISLGNGDGTFQPATKLTSGTVALAVTVADLNGDGKLDIVFGGQGSDFSVCAGNGDGTFQPCALIPQDPNGASAAFVVADLNGDGKVDIMVPNPAESLVSYLLGNGDGTFQPFVEFAAPCPSRNFAIADFNGDGRPDAAFVGGSSQNNTLGLYTLIQQ